MEKSWIYQSAAGFSPHLEYELDRLGEWKKIQPGLYRGPAAPSRLSPVWVQNIWMAPEILKFSSVKEAAETLRRRNGLWVPCLADHHRRGALIQNLLPRFRNKPKTFPLTLPPSKLGAWTLLDENTLLASPETSNPFPGGEALFLENKADPPSSAYLKLWEALTLAGKIPGPEDHCLDAGACPGGWTWVLANLGTQVLAVDRSPLEKDQDLRSGVAFRSGDGFKITPERVVREGWKPFTWIFSDMAAYPAKVWDWVGLWRESNPDLKFIITLKMQGEPDWQTMDTFQALPGSRLVHLYHNKHEVTWIKV